MRSGQAAAAITATVAPGCSAASASRTRCSLRWPCGCGLTGCRCRRSRRAITTRCSPTSTFRSGSRIHAATHRSSRTMKPASVPETRPAMSWASAIGLGARLEEAIAEATEQLEGESGGSRHDLSIAFVSAAYGAAFEELPQLLRPVIGDSLLIGCNAGGLIGGGSEEEEEPGIALLCGRMPDAVLACQHLEQATLPSLTAPREKWWRLLELGPESEPSFVLLADPTTLDAEACARGLDRAFPGSTVIGGLTSGMLEPGTA